MRGYSPTPDLMSIQANPNRTVSPGLVLGLVAVAVWTAWAWLEGGHPAWAANPLGLVLLGLLGLGVFLVGPGEHAAEPLRVAMLGLLVAFAGWNFLSILWADTPGDAWAGANKTAVYVASFALFALWPMTPRTFTVILGAFALAVAGTAAVVLLRAGFADDAGRFFGDFRLIAPIGYVNANVALWTAGLWPALYLGARRDIPVALRGLFLAAASLLVQIALLGQTRAWLIALPVAAAVYLLLQRQRLRAVLAIAIVAGSVALRDPGSRRRLRRRHRGRRARGPARTRAEADRGLRRDRGPRRRRVGRTRRPGDDHPTAREEARRSRSRVVAIAAASLAIGAAVGVRRPPARLGVGALARLPLRLLPVRGAGVTLHRHAEQRPLPRLVDRVARVHAAPRRRASARTTSPRPI